MEAVQCHRHRRQEQRRFPNETDAQHRKQECKAPSQRETDIHLTEEPLQITGSGNIGEAQQTNPRRRGNGQSDRQILDLDTLDTMR